MFEAYGPFDRFFERGQDPALGYLPLLGMVGADGVVERIRQAVADSGRRLDRYLGALLDEQNWRPQLVAAATLVVTRSPNGVLDQVWTVLDRSSWVSPQLAAAASRVDLAFVTNARLRMERSCLLDDPEDRARHHAAGVAYGERHDKKLMAAFAALCGPRPDAQHWLSPLLTDPKVRDMLTRDLREDRGGDIAVKWLEKLDVQIDAG